MCDGNYEDDLHVLFDCQRARSVWRDSHLSNDIYVAMQTNNTSADIVFALLQNLPHTKIQLFVTLVWSLWKSWNIQVWQNMSESSQSIVERAHQLLHGWTAANRCRNRFDRSVIGAETKYG